MQKVRGREKSSGCFCPGSVLPSMPASNIDCVHLKCPEPYIFIYSTLPGMGDSSLTTSSPSQPSGLKGSQKHEAGWYISFISIITASATLLLTLSAKSCDLLKQSPWLDPSPKFSALTNIKVNLLNKLYIKKDLKSKRIPIRERLTQQKQCSLHHCCFWPQRLTIVRSPF